METEIQIVYQLLESIRGSELNNDESITEREIRAYIRSYRASILSKEFYDGNTIPDNVFQDLSTFDVLYEVNDANVKHSKLISIPPIIAFNKNNGIRCWIQDFDTGYDLQQLPIQDYDSFMLSQNHPIFKHKPCITYKNNGLLLYPGTITSDLTISNPSLNDVNAVMQKAVATGIAIRVEAVLLNPSDCISYDWTLTPYPFPSELIPQLKKEILRNEFNLILQTKSDKTINMNNDLNNESVRQA